MAPSLPTSSKACFASTEQPSAAIVAAMAAHPPTTFNLSPTNVPGPSQTIHASPKHQVGDMIETNIDPDLDETLSKWMQLMYGTLASTLSGSILVSKALAEQAWRKAAEEAGKAQRASNREVQRVVKAAAEAKWKKKKEEYEKAMESWKAKCLRLQAENVQEEEPDHQWEVEVEDQVEEEALQGVAHQEEVQVEVHQEEGNRSNQSKQMTNQWEPYQQSLKGTEPRLRVSYENSEHTSLLTTTSCR
ncbi:hypothetical protein BJV74DRAFT_891890 [Russula compacta]|nr:hypothetical protein BJV74DRAFT_891890 [Russula compacta]